MGAITYHGTTPEAMEPLRRELTRATLVMGNQGRDVERLTEAIAILSIPAYTWTPMTTPPTKEDADESGDVLCYHAGGFKQARPWNERAGKNWTHWRRLPKGPTLPPLTPEQQSERERFEEHAIGQGMNILKSPERDNHGHAREYAMGNTRAAWHAWIARANERNAARGGQPRS